MTTENYTPLPVAKWTHSSMLKLHEREWSRFIKEILDNPNLSKESKNQLIDERLAWFKLVHGKCLNKELTIKK